MKKLIFVKFGGSLITDKFKEEKTNLDEIDNLSTQIREASEINRDCRFLIGNGAGSFGHIQVEKYQLKDRIETAKQKLGFSKVSNLVTYLNYLVVSSLIEQGFPAVSAKPSSIAIGSGGGLKTIFTETIIDFLKKGFVPVVYGDMILDDIKGGVVLSTDRLFYELVKFFNKKNISIDRIIFCGNTNGVLDENGRTIPSINDSIFPKIQSVFYKNSYVDVTGRMKKKVEIALKIADFAIKSYIIHGRNLKECLLGNKFPGTLIS